VDAGEGPALSAVRLLATPFAAVALALLCVPGAGQAEILFSEDFESGGSGWTATGQPQVLWHVSEDGECGAVTRMAVYGRPGACDYKTGGAHSGSFLSPVFTLHGEYSIVVQYDYRLESDDGSTCVELVDEADGKAITLIGCTCCSDPYYSLEITRAAGAIPNPGTWSGKKVRLRFGFKADRHGNSGFGCMIDNVRVVASGPPEVLYSEDFEGGGEGWTMTSEDTAYLGPPLWHIASPGECDAVTRMGAYNRAPAACDYSTKCSNSGRLCSPMFRFRGAPPFRIEFRSRLGLDARGDSAQVHVADPVDGIANTAGPFPNSDTVQPLAFVIDTAGFWSLWSEREARLEFAVTADPPGNRSSGWMVDDVRVVNSGSLPPLPELPPRASAQEAPETPEATQEAHEARESPEEEAQAPGTPEEGHACRVVLVDWLDHAARLPIAQRVRLLGRRDSTIARDGDPALTFATPKDTALLGVSLRIRSASQGASSVTLRILTLSPGE